MSVLCRYCKAEMSNQQIGYDESDGLTYLECFYECPECGSQSPHVTGLTIYETLEEAADEAAFMANNVYAETNRVLTTRELMESKGVFVWLEERDAYTYANSDGFPAWVEDGVLSFKDESLDLKDADSDVLEQYGETWRVWLTKPTDSERMSSNWVK